MKKARALFAAVIIIIIAGVSAGAWYLNKNGYIGGDGKSPSAEASSVTDANNGNNINYDTGNNKQPANSAGNNENPAENEETIKNTEPEAYDYAGINEFLSVFSRVYFAEDQSYSYNNYDTYDVLRFAYSHIFRTERELIITKQTDDSVGYYFGVSSDDVNDVLREYLGITVKENSVYTENTYAFFKYEDGYFYTPAAEGIGYTNLAIADSITEKDGVYSVSFTVYSDRVSCDMTSQEAAERGEKYAEGTAELEKNSNSFILKSYNIKD